MTEGPSNVEASERVVAAILNALFERGLQGGQFKFSDTGLPSDLVKFYDSSFLWLMEEGIVRAGNTQTNVSGEPMAVIRPALTSKGFALLGQPFAGQESYADRASKLSEGQTSISKAGDFLGSLIGGLAKSISS